MPYNMNAARLREQTDRPTSPQRSDVMTTVEHDPQPDEYRRWLHREYTRLYGVAEADLRASCSLDRVLIAWRLRDIGAEFDACGVLEAVRSLNELLRDLELLTCSPGALEVTL